MYLRYGEIALETAGNGAAPLRAEPTARTVVGPGDPLISTDASAPERPSLPMIRLHGVELNAITEQQAIAHIMFELSAKRGGFVITPNLDHLRRCVTDL